MKKLIFLLFAGLVLWVIGCQKDSLLGDLTGPEDQITQREFPPEVEAAVNQGVTWLLLQQDGTGRFGGSNYNEVARTALAVTKLCDRNIELGGTPEDGEYTAEIEAGLEFILKNASAYMSGIRLNSYSPDHDVYSTGIAMMALAAYDCPDCVINVGDPDVDGKTFQEVLQLNVQFFNDIQNPDGGWRYSDNSMPSDNSNSGFAALGLLAAADMGCTMDATIMANFSNWLDFIQNDVSGGSGYTAPGEWVNVLKTGNLLFEFGLVGDAPNSPRMLAALQYIENNWNADGSCTGTTCPGWKPNNYLAMYCLMKGLESTGVDEMPAGNDWYQEFVNVLLPLQQPAGYWVGFGWNDDYESTVFNLLTLEKITPVSILEVGFDIKPGSCPNPVNRGSKGLVPMAVLGADDFDVYDIDPATVNIGGISPVKFHFEDVSTPYEGELEDKNDCNTDGPDGYMDFFFHMDAQELATLLAGYEKGDVVVLEVEGQLIDGPAFHGADIVYIVK